MRPRPFIAKLGSATRSQVAAQSQQPAKLRSLSDFWSRRRVMHRTCFTLAVFSLTASFALPAFVGQTFAQPQRGPVDDPIASMVRRLSLERYKATIKGLTQFADRENGNHSNRAAV